MLNPNAQFDPRAPRYVRMPVPSEKSPFWGGAFEVSAEQVMANQERAMRSGLPACLGCGKPLSAELFGKGATMHPRCAHF